MALLFIESFDHEVTDANLTRKGWTPSNADVDPSTSAVRSGTYGLRLTAYNRTCYRAITDSTKVFAGTAYRFDTNPTVTPYVMRFMDGATAQVELQMTNTRELQVTRNGTLLGSASTQQLIQNAFYYIEWGVFIHDSTGTVDVKINGVSVITLTNQDTRNAGTTISRVQIGGTSGGTQAANVDYDDFYICNDSGSAPTNTFLGDCKVECKFPNENGNSFQWVGSDGNSTDNYLLVKEITPDDDTTYVDGSTVGNKDTYAFENMVTTAGTVFGVQPSILAKKTDAGSRSIASVARLSATEVDSANASLGTSYLYYTDIREAKPGGGVWTLSAIDSAEFGVKVTV